MAYSNKRVNGTSFLPNFRISIFQCSSKSICFNHGQHTRDFTFIEDIVEGVVRVCDKPAVVDANWDSDNLTIEDGKYASDCWWCGGSHPGYLGAETNVELCNCGGLQINCKGECIDDIPSYLGPCPNSEIHPGYQSEFSTCVHQDDGDTVADITLEFECPISIGPEPKR